RRAAGDGHRLLLARALVLRGHVHDAVRVDVEGDLDLRDATRSRGDAGELEGAQRLVVARELALALEDLDRDRRLVVVGGGEGLAALGRDGRVALDELGHHAALGLDAETQRGDVDEEDVLALALQDAGLEGRADRDDLVRVHTLVGLLAGLALDEIGDGGHTGRSADEHDVRDVADLDAGLADHILERLLGAVEEVLGEVLELRAGDRLGQRHRAVLGEREVGQVDAGRGRGGQLLLGLLRGLLQTLQGDLVTGDVDAGRVLELLDEVVDETLVPVVAAETVVSGRGAHLDRGEVVVLAHLEEGDVEGPAAEVEDEDQLVLLALVETVGESRSGGLVDDAQDVEARDLAGLLGGLALGVVEVGGDGDDRVGHRVSQVGLGVALELHEDARGDLLRRPLLAVDVEGPVGSHVALDRGDRAVDVGDGLALGGLADEHLPVLGEGDHRGGGAEALGIGDDLGLAALEDADDRVGRTEVDTDST
ncbi:glutamate dehydrogenase, partial [Bacillus toyonensis]|nr:glutamate dehydrogenase [Bacillus toyonensis]